VAGPLPDTAGLQALTGAMDKLEALLRSREAQSNSAGTSLLPPMRPARVLVGALGYEYDDLRYEYDECTCWRRA
jgi:hypothetical protein